MIRQASKTSILLASGLLAIAGMASAQGGFAGGIAPPEMMDTLSGASTGPSASSGYVDRARNAAASDPFAQPAGQPANPFGGPGFDPAVGGGFDPALGGNPGFAADPAMAAAGFGAFPQGGFGAFPQGGFQPNYTPQIPKVNAIYGDRVICAVTGQMLEDAYEVPILQTFSGQYYDDGENGLDYQANDNKYTNVQLVENVMSPEAHLVKTRLIQGILTLENMQPREFALVPVASSDPLAGVPHTLDLEQERDDKLSAWAERFLRDFRVNPDQAGNWEFYETKMPAPPFPPFSLLPGGFYPPFEAPAGTTGQPQNVAGGPGFNPQAGAASAFGADNIGYNPGASSSYFGAGAGGGK